MRNIFHGVLELMIRKLVSEWRIVLWTEFHLPIPPHSYVEALTPKETVFGDRAFKEIVKVK